MNAVQVNVVATKASVESAPLLSIRDLVVKFGGGTTAVSGASLRVSAGQTLAVVGESGCGKTVTALSVLRLLDEQMCKLSGAIEWQGRNILELNEKQMRGVRGGEIAMIFQEPMSSLNPVYSIGDQIVEGVRLHRKVNEREAAKLAEQALMDVGIDQPTRRLLQYPHEFSGGMRQRAMIAMALVCQPKLLLADEPTTALDVTTQVKILDLLRGLQRDRGMAMMLITHDFGVVARNADFVSVMYAGCVVEEGATRDVLTTPMHPYTKALLGARPTLRGERKKLETVHSAIERSIEFSEGIEGRRELRPWWPAGDSNNESEIAVMKEVRSGRRMLCVESV